MSKETDLDLNLTAEAKALSIDKGDIPYDSIEVKVLESSRSLWATELEITLLNEGVAMCTNRVGMNPKDKLTVMRIGKQK
jgi:hypothetical protein